MAGEEGRVAVAEALERLQLAGAVDAAFRIEAYI